MPKLLKKIPKNFKKYFFICFTLLIFLLPGVNLIAAIFFINDKEAHLSFFLVLAIYRMIFGKNYNQIVFTTILLGISIEIFQYFIPNRSFDLYDIFADSFGIMIAYFFKIGFDKMPILRPELLIFDKKLKSNSLIINTL